MRQWSCIETHTKTNGDYSATSNVNEELINVEDREIYTDISFNAIDALTLILNHDEENPLYLMAGTQLHLTNQLYSIQSLKIVEGGKKYSYVAGKKYV